jgi:hypothetical protein|tara:strand:- start:6141 stop:6536 length:396 start_codon:yes stop_codon:yes gene_type:complete
MESNEETTEGEQEKIAETLKPKKPPRLAPEGIRTFTVARQYDETGVSGEGVVIEGVTLATGQCVAHWLFPPPRGSIAVFDSMSDFITVHIRPHPGNRTIITYDDGEQERFGLFSEEDKVDDDKETDRSTSV